MTILFKPIRTFEIRYETASEVPPPYCYYYLIIGKVKNDNLFVDLEWVYHNREELTPDEILEEGFSENDNFNWQGQLGKLWLEKLQKQITVTKIKEKIDESEPFMELEFMGDGGYLLRGTPVNTGEWEYLLQEFIQGIYEASGKEAPLQIQFKKNFSDRSYFKLVMTLFFKTRTVDLQIYTPEEKRKGIIENWEQIKNILKDIYTLPYLQESGISEEPNEPGVYLDSGDGLWFEMDTAIKNPSRYTHILIRLEKYFLSFR